MALDVGNLALLGLSSTLRIDLLGLRLVGGSGLKGLVSQLLSLSLAGLLLHLHLGGLLFELGVVRICSCLEDLGMSLLLGLDEHLLLLLQCLLGLLGGRQRGISH